MSDLQSSPRARLGFLLLRDGHAAPLSGISPDEIKAGAKHLVPHPDVEKLKHKRTLTAIVDRLDFRGDFGDFKAGGWPDFQRFLLDKGCTYQAGLFPSDHGGCIDLYFRATFGPTRRQLADRLFEAAATAPERVFLGYGVDWETWDRGGGTWPPEEAYAIVGGDPSTARRRAADLFSHRHYLVSQWGFLDDQLIDGPVQHIIDRTYWSTRSSDQERRDHQAKVARAVRAFRAVFDARPEGWVDVLRYNDRLAVLRAHDGAWDLIWRGYRAEEPPKPTEVSRWTHLALEDLPITIMGEADQERLVHFRQEVWEEREAHEAEQAFYDRGGSTMERQHTNNADVRLAWLRETGRFPTPERRSWTGELPPGFREVEIAGTRLAVSALVDVKTFRRMLVETGYLERRAADSEPWDRANEGVPDNEPVGATWADAQAFCAWRERQLGTPVRLLHTRELRAIRPFYSARYQHLADLDFVWERHPPRPVVERTPDGRETTWELPSAVSWSEPRFLEPGPDLPEFPPENGWSTTSRKRWIADFPPRAPWREALPWGEHGGLRFIDAWDAYEWCQEVGWVSGRFWEGPLGGTTSWGAYKNVKVTFRLAIELGEVAP